ncbi:MAG TPA: deoxyribodipyrimidine photolyase [Candidatus Eisenbacteria bacterium]|nr:deoxyribodipyrimidine photolyase [Candidatus Eisenbacteria bacterium]
MTPIPDTRVRALRDAAPRPDGEFALYWMIMARRPRWNFGLQRAVEWAERLRKPIVILEALRCDYPWASDRFHRFILDGMAANARAFEGRPVLYYPYVEPALGAGKGLLAALAARAAVVVTDDFPAFMIPRMTDAAARRIETRFESVDSNGLFPMRATETVFPTAYAFRRHLQRALPQHLREFPEADPFAGANLLPAPVIPNEIARRWPAATAALLAGDAAALAALPIDHTVGVAPMRGGAAVASEVVGRFVAERLARYPEDRNEPELEGTSGLSPYLHFGHVAAHEVFAAVAAHQEWSTDRLAARATGQRADWWGMSEAAEAFLDQLITWRELGYNFCAHREDYDRYESLPDWARRTLEKHASDPRPRVYTVDELEAARTHDPLWNAAMNQMKREGWFHNYLRMLWGKKILEWSDSPRAALEAMIHLMNKWSLDGRNPNSYSGYAWTLGRYDRAWGPERPIFGTIRYMSSDNTARKFRVKEYIRKYETP